MTITIKGRAMYKSAPTAEVYLGRRWEHNDPVYLIENVELDRRNDGEFILQSRHPNGTDFEHDAARIFYLEGAGLEWVGLTGPTVEFRAVTLKVRHYPNGLEIKEGTDLTGIVEDSGDFASPVEMCTSEHCKDDPHVIMPYMPPKVSFKPQVIRIVLDFGGK